VTRSRARLTFFALGLLLVVLIAFAIYWNRRPVPQSFDLSKGPISPEAEPGKAYRFQVGHCGLVHMVDFDQSYWDVEVSTMSEAETQRFGINGDVGNMTLKGRDISAYRSDSGGEATLRRNKGVKDLFGCM